MTRILSALVLLPLVLGTIWFLPPAATLVLALLVLLGASREYVMLARRLGAALSIGWVTTAVLATCTAFGSPGVPVEGVLMAATIAAGAMALAAGRPGPELLTRIAAATFAPLYLGLPVGAMVAIRATAGPGPLLVLLLTVMASDTSQYYVGRLLGRRPLAPAISPAKTVEGLAGGVAGGVAAMILLGRAWLPAAGAPMLLIVGAAIVAIGAAGDLFESLLKRSAGVKDVSGAIPGHGGFLDRMDSLLFAAPVYYVFLQSQGYLVR